MCDGQNEETMNDLFTADEIDRMEAILLDDMNPEMGKEVFLLPESLLF